MEDILVLCAVQIGKGIALLYVSLSTFPNFPPESWMVSIHSQVFFSDFSSYYSI
jgi:hypothetical protein